MARSRRRAVERLLELMAGRVGRRPMAAATFHGDARQKAERLADEACIRFDWRECWVTEFTPVMGVHSGPGTLGVAFCAGREVEEEQDEAVDRWPKMPGPTGPLHGDPRLPCGSGALRGG